MEEDHLDLEESVINMMNTENMTDEEKQLLKSKIKIVDDERMPYYLQDGKKVYVDVMCNASGSIRRLNPGQLVEVEVNFIAEQVRHKIQKAESMSEKEEIFFKFLNAVNRDECSFFRSLYDSYDQVKMVNGVNIRCMAPESKKAFIADVEKNGFYLVRPPHKPLVFDDVINLYDTFPDIKPVDIYVDIFGTRQRKTLRKGVIGYQYMIILKQNSNKNFSARSTFRVNRSNLPAKDIAKKTNRSPYARTPVRLSEIYNLLASINGMDLAEFNIFMRSSALGRKSLDRILSADGNPLKIKKLKVKNTFNNANADILAAKLKTLGLRIYFSPIPEGRITVTDDNSICALHFGEYVIYDYPRRRKMYSDLFDLFYKKLSSTMIVESYRGEKHDICWDCVFNDKEINDKYEITDEIKEMLKTTTKGYVSSLTNILKQDNSKKSTSSDSTTSVPKKRGRKSKLEKEEIERNINESEDILDEDIIDSDIYMDDESDDIEDSESKLIDEEDEDV